jgi:hypothetical protein
MARMRCLLIAVSCCALRKVNGDGDAPAGPPSSSPVVRIAQRHQYLLYDVIFHEQVNKQRRALMFYLDLAMRLKRTLVLPRTRLLQRKRGGGSQFESTAEYVGWGELFNVTTLGKLHPVMELDQYVALHGKHVSLHLDNRHHQCSDSKGSADVQFNGHTLTAGYSLCTKGLQYSPDRLLSPQYAHEESIAFGEAVDQLGMGISLPLRPYVRFEQPTYDKAAAFVREHLGGAPYLAIHWRRTDFLAVRRSQPGVLQPPEALIRHARRLMQAHGLQRVYLATDCDDERELKLVNDALSPLRYMPGSTHQRSLSLLERVRAANVEIAIAAMADRFLGTRTSSFTLAITEEREAVFGKPPETGSEMGTDSSKDEL